MIVRPATPEDVPEVLPMVAKIAAVHQAWDPERFDYLPNPETMYDRWLSSRANDPRSVFLVAEASGQLVAFLIATMDQTIPIYRLAETGFIHDLWVEPDYRNEGIAKQMVMETIARFREIGVKQIRLETATANDAGRKLFESCGFRVSSIEMLCAIE